MENRYVLTLACYLRGGLVTGEREVVILSKVEECHFF